MASGQAGRLGECMSLLESAQSEDWAPEMFAKTMTRFIESYLEGSGISVSDLSVFDLSVSGFAESLQSPAIS